MSFHKADNQFRSGLLFALFGFGFWGFGQPFFFALFDGVSTLTVLGHRTVWSCVFVWVWLTMRGELRAAISLLCQVRFLALLTLTGLLIFTCWGIYIYAVQVGKLQEASAGYYIAPLVTAAFGMVFLGERPRRLQLIALAFALTGVLVYTLWLGRLPLLTLTLGLTFSTYGALRKAFKIHAERGMAVETLAMAPLGLALIAVFGVGTGPLFLAEDTWTLTLLIAAGLVTLLPLVFYNAAAARMPLVSLGLLQFIVPTGLFIVSLLPPNPEPLDEKRLVMLGFIWAGLVFYVIDLIRSSRVA